MDGEEMAIQPPLLGGKVRTTGKTDYDDRLHRVYDAGRALSATTEALWRRAFEPWVAGCRVAADVGAGTGRFLATLAAACGPGSMIVGFEPSRSMLRRARGVLVNAAAEALPVRDASVDALLLSMVAHHLDLGRSAMQFARALRPGGHVLVRSSFAGRLDDVPFYRFFPEARALDERRLPRLDDVVDAFAVAGLVQVDVSAVEQRIDDTWQAYARRIATRSLSVLDRIDDHAFAAGVSALEEAAAVTPGPVDETIDLIVFRFGR